MAEETGSSADPSMEEILASIRKIISDDAPPAETPAEPAPPVLVAEPAPVQPQPVQTAAKPVEEDIVELTQMVQDDGSVVDLNAPPLNPEPPVVLAAISPIVHPLPKVAPGENLISEPIASTAASALSSLASTLEIERLAHSPVGATYLGNGGRTLEDMVLELMRPMLKTWLDQNLPSIVERLVQKEIERIAKRS